jgi:transposase InsO family protein
MLKYPNISRKTICKGIGINRSNSYRSPKIKIKDQDLIQHIQTIRNNGNDAYCGLKRIKLLLFHQGIAVGVNKLRRVCNTYNLKPKPYTKSPAKPQDKNRTPSQIPNLLKPILQEMEYIKNTKSIPLFEVNVGIYKPNQVWAGDFTYLKFQGLWYYLATNIDLYTREIVGFYLSTRHDTNLVTTTLNRGIKHYGIPDMSHTDQGSEYTAQEYQELLQQHNITPSNSNKASPWENGFQESFYGKFKVELELQNLHKDSTYGDLYNYIANQIDYYNNYRIHTAIMTTPSRKRQDYYQNQTQATDQNIQPSKTQTQRKTQDQKSVLTPPQKLILNNGLNIYDSVSNIVKLEENLLL